MPTARPNIAVDDMGLVLPLHHIAYVVEDLVEAVEFWTTVMLAGPFFRMDPVVFDHVRYLGEPAVFDHSVAFGQWGSLVVELQQLHDVQPRALFDKLNVTKGAKKP